MEDEQTQTSGIQGHVKWFDPGKGFGFVVSEAGGPDILLHANVLRNFGQNSVADGSAIEIEMQETERGLQATTIRWIEPPAPSEDLPLSDFEIYDPEALEQIPVEPARVKWFDKGKGFGFANVFGLSEDVFVHVEVLRRSGLADLQPGEAVGLRVVDGKRGRMATAVLPWDMAVK